MPNLKTTTDIHATSQSNVRGSDDAGVSIVMVTYRNAAVIAQCMAAVAKITSSTQIELIIVDNASPDDTVKVVKATSPEVKIIERSQNGGFADGCAVGAQTARGRWLLFLNPDTLIARDAVDALLDCAAEHPDAGIIGGRFVPQGINNDPSSWWGRPTLWSTLCFASGLSTILAGNRFFDPEAPLSWQAIRGDVRTVPVICGGFMLVRRDLWDQLGGFDRTFFMYGEDADFCMRAAKVGKSCVVSARAICHHAGGNSSTSTQKLVLLFTGRCTLIRRHFRPGLRSVGIGMLLAGVLLRAAASSGFGIPSPSRRKRPTTSGENWRALWAARREWRNGWSNVASRSGRDEHGRLAPEGST